MSDGNRSIGETEDTISTLPDELLSKILAFLPVKTIVRTSALSRRWNLLWTTVPSLDLSLSDFLPRGNGLTSQARRKANFLDFVERFLRQNRPCNVDTLDLKFSDKVHNEISRVKLGWSKVDPRDYENYPLYPGEIFRHCRTDFESWIRLAECFKAHSILISCSPYMLQTHQSRPNLFAFESLVNLRLAGSMVFNIPEGSIFPNLKTLDLEEIIIKGEFSVPKLINSSCPVLEDLHVSSSGDENDFHHLVITAKNLRRLQLHFFDDEITTTTVSRTRIDFSALEYLSLRNVLITDSQSARLLGALDEANLDFPSRDDNDLFWLLTMICNVKKLTLSESTLECLYSCTLPTFDRLTCLEIEGLGDDPICGETLVMILKKSPILRDIRFEGLKFKSSSAFDRTADCKIPRCLTTCLKTIEINPIRGKRKDVEIVGYFLKHSQVLEKMIIVIKKNGHKKREIKKEILAFSKGSPECDIIFK